jgi:hypothetical protein
VRARTSRRCSTVVLQAVPKVLAQAKPAKARAQVHPPARIVSNPLTFFATELRHCVSGALRQSLPSKVVG